MYDKMAKKIWLLILLYNNRMNTENEIIKSEILQIRLMSRKA